MKTAQLWKSGHKSRAVSSNRTMKLHNSRSRRLEKTSIFWAHRKSRRRGPADRWVISRCKRRCLIFWKHTSSPNLSSRSWFHKSLTKIRNQLNKWPGICSHRLRDSRSVSVHRDQRLLQLRSSTLRTWKFRASFRSCRKTLSWGNRQRSSPQI